MSKSNKGIPRRQFLKKTVAMATAGAVFPQIVPRHVLGGAGHTPPSETVLVAGIGFGSMGGYDMRSAARSGAKIVALCDVDFGYAGKNAEQFPDATRYNDYRELLAKEKGIDGVIIGTPDHTHAMISIPSRLLYGLLQCHRQMERHRKVPALFCLPFDCVFTLAIGETSESVVESVEMFQVSTLPSLSKSKGVTSTPG